MKNDKAGGKEMIEACEDFGIEETCKLMKSRDKWESILITLPKKGDSTLQQLSIDQSCEPHHQDNLR